MRKKHISCPNPLIFINFGYDWYSNMIGDMDYIFIDIQYHWYLLQKWLILVYSNFCTKNVTLKYQSYPKSRKMDAFGQEIWFYDSLVMIVRQWRKMEEKCPELPLWGFFFCCNCPLYFIFYFLFFLRDFIF